MAYLLVGILHTLVASSLNIMTALSFFPNNKILTACLIFIICLVSFFFIIAYPIWLNILFHGTIYGHVEWEEYDDLLDRVRQTPEYVEFESAHQNVTDNYGEGLYLAKRSVSFIAENGEIIRFKILSDGEISHRP